MALDMPAACSWPYPGSGSRWNPVSCSQPCAGDGHMGSVSPDASLPYPVREHVGGRAACPQAHHLPLEQSRIPQTARHPNNHCPGECRAEPGPCYSGMKLFFTWHCVLDCQGSIWSSKETGHIVLWLPYMTHKVVPRYLKRSHRGFVEFILIYSLSGSSAFPNGICA